MKRRLCKRCEPKYRAGLTIPPVLRCLGCLMRNPHFYANDGKLEEIERNDRRILQKSRLGLRAKPKNHARGAVAALTPEQLFDFKRRLNSYLSNAVRKGKDVSSHLKRQPYVMAALKNATKTKEELRAAGRKSRRVIRQRRFRHRILLARSLAKEGVYMEPQPSTRRPVTPAKPKSKMKFKVNL